MSPVNRRNFLKASGIAAIPAIIPAGHVLASGIQSTKTTAPSPLAIKLFGDGEMFEPADYINELQKANAAAAIAKDRYGSGGAVEALEKKFMEITGKEQAVFMPSGTMANQFAIAVLSGENTKVFVQETSHVYRDEADAAQSIFQKRLMPVAKDQPFFTAQQLQDAVAATEAEEVFKTGIGAVSIENPVRRGDGRMVPIEEIRKISKWCREKNIKLHLDGARIYMASAWSGISVKEYASYFDTIYISLYKYLGASGGAILCGDKTIISKMPHLIKVHGGNMYGNWTNAAMALYRLDGVESRLQQAIKRSNEIFTALNTLPAVKISPLPGGTNIFKIELSKEIDGKKMQATLNKDYNIRMAPPNDKNQSMISVNETLLYQDAAFVINAFKKSVQA
jgi:threonine aldolase